MKKILIFLLPIILFSSCQEGCKKKVSRMFVIDRMAIDDMIIAQQSIKSSFVQKKYKDVNGFLMDGFGKKRSLLSKFILSMPEDIKLNEDSILGNVHSQILFAKLDLEEKESKAIRICDYGKK